MDSTIFKSLNVNGRLLDLSIPQVMGILNVTPDSFYAGSRSRTEADIRHVRMPNTSRPKKKCGVCVPVWKY